MAIVRCIFTGRYLNQRCQNVLHFLNPDGLLTPTQIKDELLANFTPRFGNVQNEQAIWTLLSVQKIDPPADVPTVFPLVNVHGTLAGQGAPSFLCALIRIRTAVSGRHGHGRFYMWGVHGESVLNGVFQPDALAAWQVQVANVQNRYKTSGTGPLALGVCPRNDPASFIQMTALEVPQIFGVQRRRNIGVGG